MTDRGYAKFVLCNEVAAAASRSDCRLRDNSRCRVLEERPVTPPDAAEGVVLDAAVRLGETCKAGSHDPPLERPQADATDLRVALLLLHWLGHGRVTTWIVVSPRPSRGNSRRLHRHALATSNELTASHTRAATASFMLRAPQLLFPAAPRRWRCHSTKPPAPEIATTSPHTTTQPQARPFLT